VPLSSSCLSTDLRKVPEDCNFKLYGHVFWIMNPCSLVVGSNALLEDAASIFS
jgi:hypothetical protein